MGRHLSRYLDWIRRLRKRSEGYQKCPKCNNLSLKWVKVIIYHPEEPPCFCYYTCHVCKMRTDVLPTGMMAKVAAEQGQEDTLERMLHELNQQDNADEQPRTVPR